MRKFLRLLLYLYKKKTITVNNEKYKIPASLNKYFSLRANNIIEPDLFLTLSSLLGEGDTYIDIGANIGLTSIKAAKLVGEKGKVISVEPNPDIFGQLVNLISANKLSKVIIPLNLALADKTEIIPMSMNFEDSNLMERSSLIQSDKQSQLCDVLVNSLDTILPENVSPAFIKIDVEGAELSVLNGALEVIQKNRPLVFVEIHGLYFDDKEKFVKDVFTFFSNLDYLSYNVIKNQIDTFESFMNDTGFYEKDPISKIELSKNGYGQILFIHLLNKKILNNLNNKINQQ